MATKFFWNGVKINGSKKLIKVWYTFDKGYDHSPTHLTIYAKCLLDSLEGLAGLKANQTDYQTDYFVTDHAVLTANMSDYLPALQAAKTYYEKRENQAALLQINEELAKLTANTTPI
jgi:hypothetical protein